MPSAGDGTEERGLHCIERFLTDRQAGGNDVRHRPLHDLLERGLVSPGERRQDATVERRHLRPDDLLVQDCSPGDHLSQGIVQVRAELSRQLLKLGPRGGESSLSAVQLGNLPRGQRSASGFPADDDRDYRLPLLGELLPCLSPPRRESTSAGVNVAVSNRPELRVLTECQIRYRHRHHLAQRRRGLHPG